MKSIIHYVPEFTNTTLCNKTIKDLSRGPIEYYTEFLNNFKNQEKAYKNQYISCKQCKCAVENLMFL